MKRIGLALLALLFLPLLGLAHDVPDNVTMRVFMKPVNGKMQILVRMPVVALIDVLLPMLPNTDFLDLPEANRQTEGAARLWIADLLTIREGDTTLARPAVVKSMISRELDASFANYKDALAHLNGPTLPDKALVVWDRSYLDAMLETPIRSADSDFVFVPRFGRLGIKVNSYLGYLPPSGGERDFAYEGDPVSFQLNPTATYAAARFARFGFWRLFEQNDHLLFLLCTALLCITTLITGFGAMMRFAVAFSLAHAATFFVFALGHWTGPDWLPAATGTLMAISIVYLGLESVIPSTPVRYRLGVAAACGAVFGPDFWYYLEPELQFGGVQRLTSVFSYLAGIEAGQFLALAVLGGALALFFRLAHSCATGRRRIWTMVFAGFAAHVAWHKMTERAFLLNPPAPLNRTPEWLGTTVRSGALLALGLGLVSVFVRRRKEMPQQ